MGKKIIGLTLGDSAGVGPELIAKVIAEGFLDGLCYPVIIGDEQVFKRGCQAAGVNVQYQKIEDIDQIDGTNKIPVLDICKLNLEEVPYGQVSAESGRQCIETMITCVRLCKEGKLNGFVFAPMHKTALHLAGNKHESEHHFLADLFGVQGPYGEINVTGGVMTTRTTSHIPLSEVSQSLTIEKILGVTRLLNTTLKDSGIQSPRIGVAACNPHCGDNGICGREEIEIICPAVEKAVEEGICASGPLSSDIVFIDAFGGKFDGVVTMYHDQGQIAMKLKGFDGGITISGGLPYPVVTCAQGTAFNIAGTGAANTKSIKNAISMCVKMADERGGTKI